MALQHPALAGDQQNICRVLQVCQSWRKAVQQSSANVTDVVYSKWLPPSEGHTTEYTSELPQFSHWLASNAGLVRSISIDLKQNYTVDSRTLDMTDQVLSLGLRAAAAAHQTQTAHLCSGAACPAGLRLSVAKIHLHQRHGTVFDIISSSSSNTDRAKDRSTQHTASFSSIGQPQQLTGLAAVWLLR